MGILLRLATIVFLSFVMVHGQFQLTFPSVNFPNKGFYCPHSGVAPTYTTQHLCKLACIPATTCLAINYNLSESRCTRLITPCPQANSEITMQYTLFYQRRIQECYQWRKLWTISTNHPRLVLNEKRSRIVSRLIYLSGYYPCYNELQQCFGGTGSLRMNSNQYVCELLLVEPHCIVGWLPFSAGDYIPMNTVSTRQSFLYSKSLDTIQSNRHVLMVHSDLVIGFRPQWKFWSCYKTLSCNRIWSLITKFETPDGLDKAMCRYLYWWGTTYAEKNTIVHILGLIW